MTPIDDTDVLASFNRRLAGIEADVKDGSPSEMPRRAVVARPIAWRPRSPDLRVVVPLLAAIALVVAITVIRPIAAGPGPSAGPVASLPAAGDSPSSSADPGQGPARLRIQGYEQLVARPGPSGITVAPQILPTLHFRVALTSENGGVTLTIPADTSLHDLDLTPGSYEVEASERTEIVDVDNGRNIVGVPGGTCVIRLDLRPGTTTLLAVTAVYGQACGFDQRLVDAPTGVPPSSAPASPSPASSKLPKSPTSRPRAIDLAHEEAPADASYESISAGSFRDLQVTPPWTSLDRYISPAHLVWVARFADVMPGCSSPVWCGETVVYLDYLSGVFLVSVHAPAAP